jgi:hypothetical protein
LEYQKKEVEPKFLTGKIRIQYDSDMRLWLCYKGKLNSDEIFVFEFRCCEKNNINVHAIFRKGVETIFITDEEVEIGKLFDTIKTEMKKYSFSHLYSK